jgi:hypothetical protein
MPGERERGSTLLKYQLMERGRALTQIESFS